MAGRGIEYTSPQPSGVEMSESLIRVMYVSRAHRRMTKGELTDLLAGARLRNEKHGITPQSVKRAVQESLHQYLAGAKQADKLTTSLVAEDEVVYNAVEVIREMEAEMAEAATKLEFEKAAHLRDQIKELRKRAGME